MSSTDTKSTSRSRVFPIVLMAACLLPFLPPVTTAQYGWRLVHPRPGEQLLTTSPLMDVHFADARHGFIVGFHGTVLRTMDGENWEALHVPLSGDPAPTLRTVVSDPAGNIYIGGSGAAGGSGGVLWYSTDSGDTWTDISMPPEFDINELRFIGDRTLIAVGDSGHVGSTMAQRRAIIRKSTDAGLTWRTVASIDSPSRPGSGVSISDVQFPSADTAYATVTDAMLLRSVDGGETWHRIEGMEGMDFTYYGLHFFSAAMGFVYGRSSLVPYTNDGGISWDTSRHAWEFLTSTCFVHPDLGFAGTRGIARTTDQGRSWDSVPIEPIDPARPQIMPSFGALMFTDPQHGWAVGDNGAIYRTTTGGLVSATPPTLVPQGIAINFHPHPLSLRAGGGILTMTLPSPQRVRLSLYDILGRQVRTLYDGMYPAGKHDVRLDPDANIRPGMYFLVLQTSGETAAAKILVQ